MKVPDQPAWTRIVLRWVVAGARPGVIEWTITDASASAQFKTAGGVDELDLVAPVSIVRDGQLVHIDCGPALNATIRIEGGSPPRVLFARTSLLPKLGVAGGRARVDGCELECELECEPQIPVVRRGRVSSS